jgi:AraC family transcriptional activator of pobA
VSSQIKNILFKTGLTNEIEIIPIADTLTKHRKNITLPHRDSFYNVFWYQQGSATHFVDFEPITVKPNSILFVDKNRVQMLDPKDGYDGKFLLFTDTFFDKRQDNGRYLRNNILFNDLLGEPVLNISPDSPIISVFNDIELELSRPNDTVQYELLHNLLHNFLLLAERERRTSGFIEIKKGAALDNTILFKNLLEDNYKTLKSVAGLACLMSISEKQLNKATATTLGKSPKELINERVVLEAKRLLAHTNDSIKKVGFELGFDEPTNFVKYFHKHEAKTPMEFRKLFSTPHKY